VRFNLAHLDLEGEQSSFKWPACPVLPAYWSRDLVGAEPISWEDAANLGFPSLHENLGQRVASVYAGVCQFHQTNLKGFDPDSLDIAQHLGQPLYEVSSEINLPFAQSESPVPKWLIFAHEMSS
jgi:hypothetical protein